MKTKALLLVSISLATAFGQSDIPDTGLAPPPRFAAGAYTSAYRAVLTGGNRVGTAQAGR